MKNLTLKLKNGNILQAFEGEYIIREFRSLDDMNKAMELTNNFNTADILTFYKYIVSFTQQYTPISQKDLIKKSKAL